MTSGGVNFIGASVEDRVRAFGTTMGADDLIWAVGGRSILKPQVADQIVTDRPED